MRLPIFNRLKACFSAFNADRSGIAVVYVAVALPVIIGFSLLAIDFGRLATLQSSLQHGADALALAGAGELDRSPTAIDRANLAITNLMTSNTNLVTSNNELFPTTAATVSSGNVTKCYLKMLPPNDATAIPSTSFPCMPVATPADRTSSSSAARFVQVVVNPTNFTTIFPATFIGAAANTSNSTAQAVAGFDAAVCNFTPMFMCNPLEPTNAVTDDNQVANDYGLYSYVQSAANRRRLILMKSQQNQWAPGNFGFLDSALGNGASGLAQEIVATKPNACFIMNSLTTKTGNMATLQNAFNVRFDMYANGNVPGGGSWKSFPPATNVRKGYTITPKKNGNPGDACIDAVPAKPTEAIGFPIDPCFATSCPFNTSGRIGDGLWDFDNYWNVNFNHPPGSIPRPNDANGLQYSNASNRPTRWEIYQYEINHSQDVNGVGQLLKQTSTGPAAAPEVGLPKCVSPGVSIPDRRTIYAAVINCGASGLSQGKTSGLHALAFGQFFMTKPMDQDPVTNDYRLYMELVGIVQPGDASGVARDRVQLYR